MNFLQHKITAAERAANGVISAPDTLSGTPRENKSVFDKLVGFFVDKYNLMLDALQTVSDGLDTHTASQANPHAVTKAQVGLGSVDNTADMDKPIPAAQVQVNTTTSQKLTAAQTAADNAVSVSNSAKSAADGAATTATVAKATADGAAVNAEKALSTATGIAATAQDALFVAKDARTLAESVAIVYDPTTGTQVTVSVALQSIYELVKSAPMTAQDFADNRITVDFFRSKKMTAAEYATRGKQILLGG